MFNTFVKQTQAWNDGRVSISIYKQKIRPDGSIAKEQPHRMMIEPGDDVQRVITENNKGLRAMGYPAIDPAEIDWPLALRVEAMEAASDPGNPIRSVEINSGGGVRLSAHPQTEIEGETDEDDDPEFIVLGPFDDIDIELAKHNAKMAERGCLPVMSGHLSLALAMRATAHAYPLIQERMAVEAEKIAEQRRKDQAEAALREEERLRLIAEQEAGAQQRIADEEARKAAEAETCSEAVKAEVAKQLTEAKA